MITEITLATYVAVSLTLYWRRPGLYLARTPTSIAAVIALFVSSAAVTDFRGALHMKSDERAMYLAQFNCRYGYGSYFASDGAVHVGIEKVPYVKYMRRANFKGSRAEQEMLKRKECEDDAALGATRKNADNAGEPMEEAEGGEVTMTPVGSSTLSWCSDLEVPNGPFHKVRGQRSPMYGLAGAQITLLNMYMYIAIPEDFYIGARHFRWLLQQSAINGLSRNIVR
jgi:hypothetical protein